jgi:hypothetical protein
VRHAIAQHLPLGSGAVERLCTSLIAAGLKYAGMRWAPARAQSVSCIMPDATGCHLDAEGGMMQRDGTPLLGWSRTDVYRGTGEQAMKNLGDMAKRFLQEHAQGPQPQQEQPYTPQPQPPSYSGPGQQPQIYGGRPRPYYPGEPPDLQSQERGSRPTLMRGVVPPNPYYTPPRGYQPQGSLPQGPYPQPAQQPPYSPPQYPAQGYPPQGYPPQQQGGGLLGGMGGGLLSGLAGGVVGSIIGNEIFGHHDRDDVTQPRDEIINNYYEGQPQAPPDPNAGYDPGYDPTADADAGGWDSFGGDSGGDWSGGDGGGW